MNTDRKTPTEDNGKKFLSYQSSEATYEHSTKLKDVVRNSCRHVLAQQRCTVELNKERIDKLLSQQEEKFTNGPESFQSSSLRFPLNFNSPQSEVGFITLLSLLSFGAGHKHNVRLACGRSLEEVLQFGLIGMHISVSEMNAQWMKSLTLGQVSEFFNLPLDVEEELKPGIYIAKPGPAKDFAELVTKVINESGNTLLQRGYKDLGSFVCKNVKTDNGVLSAAYLVKQLADTFPPFNDHCRIEDAEVILHCKAQRLARELFEKFGTTTPDLFAFADMDNLSPSISTKFCEELVRSGLAKMREADTSTRSGLVRRDYELRAAGLEALSLFMEKGYNLTTVYELFISISPATTNIEDDSSVVDWDRCSLVY